MNWVTIIWSMVASASLTLAAINLLVWSRDRRSWAHLCFSFMVVGVIGLAGGEMGTMKAASPEEFGRAILWTHLVYAIGVVGCLGFVHFYFGTGRRWLLAMAVGLRLLAVVMNFTTGLNPHISAIQSLQKVTFLGEQVTVLGQWVANPWAPLGPLASFVWLIYVVDASVRLWRAGSHDSRRRAVIVGGALAFFIVVTVGQSALVVAGVLRMPFVVSLPFLGVVLAMSYELSRDMIRAAQLARELELEASQRKRAEDARNNLAAIVESSDDAILSKTLDGTITSWNAGAEKMYGYSGGEMVGQHVSTLAPDDLKAEVTDILEEIRRGESVDHLETVRVTKDGRRIDVSLTISPIRDEHGMIIGASTIARDITERNRAEQEALQQRSELAHLSRVTMLGELSGSMAHELNQPLMAILSNAQAAQRFMAHDDVDLDEVREILADIVEQDNRAGEVIRRLRLLLKKGEVHQQPLDVNDTVREVLKLIRSDLVNQSVALRTQLAPALPTVKGDRVQFQQVLLNLLMNACDAMSSNEPADRQMVVRTELANGAGVSFSVSDRGPGIDPKELEKVFEPFFTTKTQGLGLGLSVCRTIISAHGGKLWAANNPDRGATFHFTLPVNTEANL